MTAEHAPNTTVLRLFQEQVAAVPAHTAVLWDSARTSYAQLDALSDNAAFLLRDVPPGSVVGVEMDRGAALMPCLLGIFKAGCAYVPLLPSLPLARRDFLRRDSGAAFVFAGTGVELRPDVPGCAADDIFSVTGKAPRRPLPSPDDLAYVLYTSGSTGQPKGVQVTHGALANRILWQQSVYPIGADDVLLQKTSLGFDVSLWELFWALTQGAALRVPEPGAEKDPRRLMELIAADGIRTVHFVPSMLTAFLDAYAAAGKPPLPLGRVIVSGEALTPALNARFYALFPQTTLHNLYGPTECAVDVLYYDCQPGDTEIPIGHTVWNTGAHVLDEQGEEVPLDAVGSLCISGVQLARGYTDSALTAERFTAHPRFGRIYHTGDLASRRADGEILYHGRQDGQVKIRGQRVELGEIEATLAQIPEVQQAAVLWTENKLHAFVRSTLPLTLKYAHEELAHTLPRYMLPDSVTRVEQFALGNSGKLDRNALLSQIPAPTPERTQGIVPPRSPAEHTLADILTTQFGQSRVSMTDPPTCMGLDSLELVRLSTLLGAQGLNVPVNNFYTAPTWRALLSHVPPGGDAVLLGIAGDADAEGTAYVGIPYGGGGYGVWRAVAAELTKSGGAFYALRSAHEDPAQLCEAVCALPQKRVVILGACVGAGSALTLAACLEALGRAAVGVFLVAAVLVNLPMSPWKFFTARGINRYLAKINGGDFALSQYEIAAYRADTNHFFAWQRRPELPKTTPVHFLAGTNDPMLAGFDAPLRWEKLLGRPITRTSIEQGMHYLPHTHAHELARWVLGQ
ncbi:MAG: amino acid adenylation domain-containing protein [Oscillospiraceae bacterium]|jgi:amino acid adenylation domain-containing protein|nr:amino acid adenylation domain-containing protein [Oscillospiraceae bacterium]